MEACWRKCILSSCWRRLLLFGAYEHFFRPALIIRTAVVYETRLHRYYYILSCCYWVVIHPDVKIKPPVGFETGDFENISEMLVSSRYFLSPFHRLRVDPWNLPTENPNNTSSDQGIATRTLCSAVALATNEAVGTNFFTIITCCTAAFLNHPRSYTTIFNIHKLTPFSHRGRQKL